MISRRSFFGTAAAAIVAAPAVAAQAASPSMPGLPGLAMSIGTSPMAEAIEAISYVGTLKMRPFAFAGGGGGGGDRHYVYRTGFPSIDALRSVSGVHRYLMEKRINSEAQA